MAKALSSVMTTVTNAKFEVEKFDGTNNFGSARVVLLVDSELWAPKKLSVDATRVCGCPYGRQCDGTRACELGRACMTRPCDGQVIPRLDGLVQRRARWWPRILNCFKLSFGIYFLVNFQKYSVMRDTSAKNLWDTLEEKFLTKSLKSRLYMKKKLYRFTYAPGTSMNDHVNSFNKILTDLLNLDEKFEDEDKALLLLNSLPDEYDHLTTILLHGKDTITFDAVHNAFNKSGRRSKSKGRPAKDECAFCRQKGHWKKSCPKLQKGKAIFDACVVEHDEESDFSLVGMAMACHTDEWIWDLGCTYHMCPNKDWFSSLKELECGVVFMGNDSAYVRYVASLKKNLISLGVLESKGITITLRDGLLKVVDGVFTVMKGIRRNNLYYLNGSTIIGSTSTTSAKDADSDATRLWHMRLGHAGEKALQNLVKQAIHNTKGILDYVHNDVWGPTKWLLWETGRKVKRLRSYNGTEYKNDQFLQVCQDEGIVQHFTIRDTPQQNGVAERMNQTIMEKVRCMLSNARLGKEFWAEAVTYACHLINRLPSAVINGKTPMEMWTDKPATDYDSLHIFGSTAYYHVKESKKIIFSRDVTFDESTMMKNKDSQKDDKTSSILQQVELKKVNDDPANIEGTNYEEVSTQELLQQQDSIAYRRPRRETCMPTRFDDMVAYALPIANDNVPSTYTEARSNPDGLDVKTAFLHCNLEVEFYMTQPDGFKKLQEGIFIYLLLYVDDMLIASNSKVEIERLKTQLNLEFEMKDLGEAKKIIGMKICRDRAHGRVSLSQKQYLKKLSAQLSLSTNTEQEYMLQVLYSNAVGSLMYTMMCTRPDISQAVSIVSKYMHNPGKGHWQAVKWILRYIQKTMDVRLLFKQDTTLGKGVIGYVDSEYAVDLDKRRSTTGYVSTLEIFSLRGESGFRDGSIGFLRAVFEPARMARACVLLVWGSLGRVDVRLKGSGGKYSGSGRGWVPQVLRQKNIISRGGYSRSRAGHGSRGEPFPVEFQVPK
ncbi:hypothetical protein CXB51_006971 [Gossypium anomalum]|uniref:Integrase catalytic domain-containing protein n=1 Tax=Gossypium anomalum TaxID=47600 RepID=A0A8J6D966_9ROSI|nr:hypothetical protein CXB51_006971 [Gossypium anomalum]